MAYSTGVCNLLVLNVPRNYSTSKLKSELEEIGGQGSINEIKQLEDNCVMLVVKSRIAQRKLLLQQFTITFGEEDSRLEIKELEDDSSEPLHSTQRDTIQNKKTNIQGTNDKNAIYTYDAPDSKTQNVLIYLSKSEEHKNSLITELRKYNAHLSDISPLAMMIRLSEGHGYKVDQTIIKKTVIDFIGRFSSWTEVLDSVSPANDKHIESVLSQYRDKCLGSWIVGSSTILVTGPRKSVEKIENLIRNHLEHTTYKSVETILFDPQETPAAVLKFVLNDATAKRELGKICVKFANVVVKNERGQVQIHFSPKQKNFSPAQKGNVNKAITDFLEKFVSKNRKFDKDKIKIVIKDNRDIFKPKPGSFFIQLFSNSRVKITGRIDMVKKKLEEIDYEMDCETEEEELPADIFIAQRQCEVWKTVEENCKKEGFKISISSSNEKSKIIYKGLRDSITRARINLGEICELLISLPVSGLSSDQLEFIKRCKESQKNFKTEKNILDSLYKIFQSCGVRGSLSFQPSSIVLITANEDEWQRGNRALKESVVSFEIPPVLLQSKISYAKYLSDLKKYFDSSPVYVNYQRAVKKIKLVCFLSDLQEIKQQIETFDDRIESIEYVKKCYPMSEYVAQHIRNQCQIEKAKTIELAEEGRQAGLLITYDKEDSDTVEMRLDELQQEITSKDIKLTGYSLFEYLNGEGKAKLSGIEQQTNCSIFLKSSDKVGVVKGGNILNERCDAILNSTDAKLSLSGQMSRALIQKYGQNVIADCIQTSEWLIPMQLCVCSSLKYNLPWKYIFNIVPPNDEQELKSAIKNLFVHANRLKITSLALPAIGTGNMGLDPTVVAKCMKDAFAEVTQENFTNLKDVRLVLYDSINLPIFKDVVSIKENMSSGAVATVYGNTPENLRQAEQGLKDFRDKTIKTLTIKNATSVFAKSCISEICEKYDVFLEWKQNSMLEKECHLHGVSDRVKKAEEEIKKLLEADFPSTWSPLTGGETVKKYKLMVGSAEYETVRARFAESSPPYENIINIERIQNQELYKNFKPLKDSKMNMAVNSGQSVTRQLFHGTIPDTVEPICRAGFDRGFTGANGTVYGRGSYFALKSSYSVSYTGQANIKYIFLAEVITGDYTQGRTDYKTAPEKDSTGMKYDSCVDNVSNPTIFVVFKDASAYPLYLITFQ